MGRAASVSVVIPAFNVSRFIDQAIASVLAQSHRPVEIVVVDDGSTDDTAAVVERFGHDVRLFRQPNSGAAVARNRGLTEARGEYISFLDADDVWHPRKLEIQLAHLQSCDECAAVYCRKIEVRGNSALPSWEHYDSTAVLDTLSRDPQESGWLYLELLRSSVVHTSTVTMSRKVLDEVGRFDETLRKGQDLEFWLRLSRVAPIHMLDTVLSAYRIHRGSISHRAMHTNYHAQVVEGAVGRFGPSDPVGNRLGDGELARILGLSWFEFAYQHFKAGSLRCSLDGARRSIQYAPGRWGAWVLAARAAVTGNLRKFQRVT